jgi:hypothetical protein
MNAHELVPWVDHEPESPVPDSQSIASAFLSESRKTLRRNADKILHCLHQLSDADVNWRAFPAANSIANIVSHLCGNVGQWIIAAIPENSDHRHRPGEFARDLHLTRDQLIKNLTATTQSAEAAIASVTPEMILAPRKIQGFDETVLSAIFHTVSHFEGHTHQIVYITRLRLGDRYVFKWTPTTPEQISASTGPH